MSYQDELQGEIDQINRSGEGEGEGGDASSDANKALLDELKALRKEREDLRALAKEQETSARYWAEKAEKLAAGGGQAAGASAAGQPAASEEDDESDPAQFVDELTSKGVKALKGKFVTVSEAKQMAAQMAKEAAKEAVQEERARLAGLSEVMQRTGIASDPELQQAALAELKAVQERFPSLSEAEAVELAAERAALKMNSGGNGGGGGNGARGNAGGAGETRDQRIMRQGGGGSGSGRFLDRASGATGTNLNANDRNLLSKLGAHLNEKDFLAAKARRGEEW